ncbi:MAG: hypothetical protein K2H29_02240, partial [Oscillospiraceae bacterium]|nr:hypothetical protein [Oscillospiraceae bacterium]
MAENSVGTISLDLVVNNDIAEQLEKAKSTAERSAKQLSESIESFIEAPMKKTAENVKKTLGSAFEEASKTAQKNIEQSTESIEEIMQKAVKRMKEQEAKWSNAEVITVEEAIKRAEAKRAALANTKSFTPRKEYMTYDTKVIEKEINEQGSKIDSQIQKIFDRAKNFKIPTTPVERLESELENTRTKTSLLQRQWQELSAAKPTEKVVSQMLKIQQQIVSTQTASKRLESQLAELNKTDLSRLQQECNELVSLVATSLKGVLNTALAPILAVVSGIKKIGKACHTAYEKIKYYLENPLYVVRDAGKAAFSAIKKVGNKAFGVLKLVGGKALDSLKSRFGFLNKSAISLTKPIKKLGTTLKNTFRRVFVMATLYAAVKTIKNSFSEILKSNDELSKSLNDVKANLNIAFTPIIQAVMPALNTMMSGLAKVTRYIAG